MASHLPVWEEQRTCSAPCFCRMKKEDDSLTIFGVAERDQGSYTCVASTELDQDLAKAHLTVLGNCHHPHQALMSPSPCSTAARPAVSSSWSQGQHLWSATGQAG